MFNNSIKSTKWDHVFLREQKNGSPLSKAHIRPQIEYFKGSSVFKTTKGRKGVYQGGGKRCGIKGFSKGSRYRLLKKIGRVKREADLPMFVTLTYPQMFPTIGKAKRDLKIFLQRLARKYPGCGAIWKLEPQQRGAPHYHLLVWGVAESELFDWVLHAWYEIAGQGDIKHLKFHAGVLPGSRPCVASVRSWRGVWSYASKYLGKTFEVAEWGQKWVGRFWGAVNSTKIPFGEKINIDTDYKNIVQIMRYQRRFSGLKRCNGNSFTIFCDADQWVEKLLPVKGARSLRACVALDRPD